MTQEMLENTGTGRRADLFRYFLGHSQLFLVIARDPAAMNIAFAARKMGLTELLQRAPGGRAIGSLTCACQRCQCARGRDQIYKCLGGLHGVWCHLAIHSVHPFMLSRRRLSLRLLAHSIEQRNHAPITSGHYFITKKSQKGVAQKNIGDERNASVPITAQLRGWYTLDACGENDICAGPSPHPV